MSGGWTAGPDRARGSRFIFPAVGLQRNARSSLKRPMGLTCLDFCGYFETALTSGATASGRVRGGRVWYGSCTVGFLQNMETHLPDGDNSLTIHARRGR